MKVLFLFTLLTQMAFATIQIENTKIDGIDKESTCLDEYLQRESELKKWLIWSPPATVVATPITFVGGFALGAASSKALGIYGWDALGMAAGSGFIFGMVTITAGVTVEAVTLNKFYENRLFLRSIIEVNSDLNHYKYTKKLLRKINKKLGSPIELNSFIYTLKDLDNSGALCDGSLKKNIKNNKLKRLLTRKKDLVRFFK